MKNSLKRFSVPVATLFLLSWVIASPTFANAGPWGHHWGHDKDGKGDGCTHSVPEPATLALLGIGLASLGLYGKKKKDRNKH